MIIKYGLHFRQSFLSVEKSYLETIDNKLLQRASLQFQLPEGISHYDAYRQYPQIVKKIKLCIFLYFLVTIFLD